MVCLKDQANWKLDGARRLAPNIDVPPIRSMFGFSRAPNPHRPLRAGPPLAPFRTRLARQSHILLPWFFVALVGTSASFAESKHAQTKARLGRQSRALQGMIDELREERLNGWTGLGIQIGNGKGEEGKPRLTEEEIERRLMVVGLRERPKVDSEEALKLGEENEFAWEEEGIKRGFWDRLLKGKSQGEKKAEELESQASFNEWMASLKEINTTPSSPEPSRLPPGWDRPPPLTPQPSSTSSPSASLPPLARSIPTPPPTSFDVIPSTEREINERLSYEQKKAWAEKAFM